MEDSDLNLQSAFNFESKYPKPYGVKKRGALLQEVVDMLLRSMLRNNCHTT